MSLDVFKLDGRIALVTGGNRGLGFAMSRALAEAGADVVVTSRQLEKAQASAAGLTSITGRRALGLPVDVTDSQQVKNMIDAIMQEFGHIDILVNNAGINIRKPLEEFDEASWDHVQNTNLKAPFLCSRAVAPYMKQQRSGRIINVASMLASPAWPNAAPIAPAKAAFSN